MHDLRIYQIRYESNQELDSGFEVLDNTRNERPDWFEYWPIRTFLLNETLNENTFYGFLSAKFALKTSLSSARVREFMLAADDSTDVVLFSPSIHNSAYYLNVFDHGEAEHPGLKQVAKRLFERLGVAQSLDSLVSDSRNTVFGNYIVAKPRFWSAWLAINEQLFAIAESHDDALGEALRRPTSYRGGPHAQMKIFIMERIASWLLASDPGFTTQVRDPFVARSRIYKLPGALACDALKIAYLTQGRAQYKDVFQMLQGLRNFFNFQIRLGGALRFSCIRPYLRSLKSHWTRNPGITEGRQ